MCVYYIYIIHIYIYIYIFMYVYIPAIATGGESVSPGGARKTALHEIGQ